MQTSSPHWRAIAALIWPSARRYAVLTAVVVASSALVLAAPLLLRTIIDRSVAGAATGDLALLAGWYLAIAIGSQASALGVSYLAAASAWETANTLRLDLARHVLGLDHEFHRSHSPGEMIERIDGDVTSVSDFLATVVIRISSALVLVGGVIVVVTVLDWRLGLGMALYALATAGLVFRHRNRSVSEAEDELSAGAILMGGIEERLTASEDLRANGAGQYAVWRFVEDTSRYVQAVVARELAFLGLWRRLNGAVALGAILALVVGGYGVSRGSLSVGTAFLLFQYSQQIRRPLEDIIHELELVQKANGAMVRVVKLLATTSAVIDEGDTSPPDGALSVTFEGVTFSYGDGSRALDNLSFVVEAGNVVGVIGHTGSGKTTVSRLLARLIEVDAGEIRFSGVPIDDIPADELRQRVAVVPQNVELMQGTVRDNVTLFDHSYPDEDIDRALGEVGLDRYRGAAKDELLGAGGSGLSAGEGQLLALARVWLRQPDLVILDEPTARIDPVTEQRLEAAMSSLFAGRTVFVIAHRLSTLQRADQLLIVEHGRLAEVGSRGALAADSNSRFHELLVAGMELEQVRGDNS